MSGKKFALIGAAGYIAPRHMEAIQKTGNDCVAVLDPNDSVGIIDRYFPKAAYFRESERFDRHLDRMARNNSKVDYVSICSPNYLHDAHMRLGLRNGCDVICEKPLVLKTEHIDSLREIESDSGKKIYTVLQLRLHPAVIQLREKIMANPQQHHKVDIRYVTPRGTWYNFSWKGDDDKSGGVATNIGIHFFDMLLWLFGDVKEMTCENTYKSSVGSLKLDRADVNWKLSIDPADLENQTVWQAERSIVVDGETVDFSAGFTDLHVKSYEEVLAGRGFTIDDAYPSIQLVEKIRQA